MQRITTLIAGIAALLAASSASAALYVSSPQSAGITAFPGETITIDIVVTTTFPEAYALGLRAADYDPAILANGTGTVVPTSIFNFSPSIPFGGLTNSASGAEQAPLPGVRAGWSINLFQGVSTAPAAGSGPDAFQIQFTVAGLGVTVVNIGAFASYSDAYLGTGSYQGGSDVVYPASVEVTVVPEPGTALLLGLGLAALAAAGRKD